MQIENGKGQWVNFLKNPHVIARPDTDNTAGADGGQEPHLICNCISCHHRNSEVNPVDFGQFGGKPTSRILGGRDSR